MRPLSDLRSNVEAHLAGATGQRVSVRAVEPLGGGACQDNYRVDLAFEGGEFAGERRMVPWSRKWE